MVSCFGRSCSRKPREDESEVSYKPEEVQALHKQCLQANNGELIVYGLFARANAVNNNKRLYPKRVLMREVAKYTKEQIKGGYALGELDHPSYSCPTFKYLNLPNISHQVLSVKWNGNALWGYIQVLDTPSGRLIKSLYEKGHKLGVSSRGWASLRDLPGKPYKCIMDNFELITFDFVTEPSTRGAWLLPCKHPYPKAIPPQKQMELMSHYGLGALPMEAIRNLPCIRDFEEAVHTYEAGIKQVRRLFPVKRMLGPNDWSVKRRQGDKGDGEDGKAPPRNEPAATDLRDLSIVRHICPNMADKMRLPPALVPAQDFEHDDSIMYIPKAMTTEMQIQLPNGFRMLLHYGAYVVHASRYGVPKQRGLRDYWRHAFLFKERAIVGAADDAAPNALSPEAQQAQLDARTAITTDLDPAPPPPPFHAPLPADLRPMCGGMPDYPLSTDLGQGPDLRAATTKYQRSDSGARHSSGAGDRLLRPAKRNGLLDMCLHDSHVRELPDAVCVAEDGARGGAAAAPPGHATGVTENLNACLCVRASGVPVCPPVREPYASDDDDEGDQEPLCRGSAALSTSDVGRAQRRGHCGESRWVASGGGIDSRELCDAPSLRGTLRHAGSAEASARSPPSALPSMARAVSLTRAHAVLVPLLAHSQPQASCSDRCQLLPSSSCEARAPHSSQAPQRSASMVEQRRLRGVQPVSLNHVPSTPRASQPLLLSDGIEMVSRHAQKDPGVAAAVHHHHPASARTAPLTHTSSCQRDGSGIDFSPASSPWAPKQVKLKQQHGASHTSSALRLLNFNPPQPAALLRTTSACTASQHAANFL